MFALWGSVQDQQHLLQLPRLVQDKSRYQQSLQTGCRADSGSWGPSNAVGQHTWGLPLPHSKVLLKFVAGVLWELFDFMHACSSRKVAFVSQVGPREREGEEQLWIILDIAHNFFIGVTFLEREPAVCH